MSVLTRDDLAALVPEDGHRYELVDGVYVEIADVGADDAWTAERPFPVTIRPGELAG